VTPVRPPFPQTTGPGAGRPDAARNAAQRAFFQAALGQAQGVAPQGPAPAPRAPRVPTNLPAEPPARILRPGSLLDIKV